MPMPVAYQATALVHLSRVSHHCHNAIALFSLMSNPLAFLDDPTPTIRHRLVDTAKHGRIYVCSCGRNYPSLTAMQEHIRAMNERHDDDNHE